MCIARKTKKSTQNRLKKCEELFAERLLQWYKLKKRVFTWRKRILAPYQVLVLEIMLQRTPAERVNELFHRFLKKYPDAHAILRASDENLESDIHTLGLQRRRRILLKNLAVCLVERYNGRVPINEKELLQLPGVGKYVANAVLCYSHGKSVPLIDTNAARVLGRVFGLLVSSDPSSDEHLWTFTQRMLPQMRVREFNWALIDLGALICRPKTPVCNECPMFDRCLYAISKRRLG